MNIIIYLLLLIAIFTAFNVIANPLAETNTDLLPRSKRNISSLLLSFFPVETLLGTFLELSWSFCTFLLSLLLDPIGILFGIFLACLRGIFTFLLCLFLRPLRILRRIFNEIFRSILNDIIIYLFNYIVSSGLLPAPLAALLNLQTGL